MNKFHFIPFLFIALSLQSQGNFQNRQLDSLLLQLDRTTDTKKRIGLLDQISFSLSRFDPAKGVTYASEALKLAEKIGSRKDIASAHAELGINYAALSRNAEAFRHDSIALAIYTQLGMKSSIAGVLANISNLYLARSDYSKSLEYGFKALKVNEELNDEINKAIILENIGTVYFEQKMYDKALEYYSKAVASYKKLNNTAGIARGLGNLGIVQDALASYEQSLNSHKEALKINRQLGNRQSMQINLVNIGIVYCHLKRYKDALTYQYEALKLSEELDNISSIAINEGNIGETYYFMATDTSHMINEASKKSYMAQAAVHLERGVDLCRNIGFLGPFIEFSQYLSEAYSAKGDHKKALAVYKEYSRIKDSVFSGQNQVAISGLETERALLLKQKDIILKDKQLEIARLQNINKRNENMFLIIGILLMTAVLLVLIWELRRSRRTEKKIKFLNEELERNIRQLGQMNKDLEAFAYSVSHDLRAPLRAVGGYITMLEDDYCADMHEDGKRMIQVIRQNAKKMGILIDELLAFAKLGQKELQKSKINMKQLAKSVIDGIDKSMPHKAEITVSEMPEVIADHTLIQQVMFNLLSNAVKYSSKKDRPVVEVHSEKKADEVVFTVRDNGSGFDMAYADKLFGVFQRLHSEEEFEGSGVGLALVERVVHRHGGRVWAVGEPEKGATFSFSLPVL